MKEFTIGSNDCDQRIDKFITKLCPNIPQSMLYKSFRKDCVKINNKHIKDASTRLCLGDNVKLYLKDEFFQKEATENSFMDIEAKLNIIYEDENIILVDKKSGMVVHEDDENSQDTLINHIKSYLYNKGEYNPQYENSFVPSLCNRLDRNTRGIVICAKNAPSLRIMNQKIKDRELTKKYLCIALGNFSKKEDTLNGFLFKDEKEKRVYIYNQSKKGTKTVITKYRVLSQKNDLSLVEVELITGRTHQIRAHLASINHPLLGDGKYGINKVNKEYKLFHQALCSYKLSFDFTTDAGILEYLNGKTFIIPNIDKEFLKIMQ